MQYRFIKIATISSLLASSTLLANSTFSSLGVNLGQSHTSFEQKKEQGEIILAQSPKKRFNSIELYTTLKPFSDVCKEYNIKPYLSYTYSKNSKLQHQYLLAGLNKYFTPSTTKTELYIGAVGGYAQLSYRYDPLNNADTQEKNAYSFVGGLQLGASYPIYENISLGVSAKYLLHKYKAKLETSNAKATIEHDSTATFLVGLEYSF